MSKRFLKTVSLALAVFLMTASLGACKKDSKKKADSGSVTKTVASSAKSTTSKKGTTTESKKNASTKTSKSSDKKDSQSNNSNGTGNFNSAELEMTSADEMVELINNDPDKKPEVVNIDTDNMDLGGRTIKIVFDTSSGKSPGTKPTSVELAQNPKAIVKYNTIENAKKKLNFNIEWKYRSVDNMVYEYLDETAAGKKYADILLTATKRAFPKLAVKQLLVPMDNFINFESDPVYNFGTMSTGTKFMGRVWGFSTNPYGTGYVVFYNREIFAKEGLTDLQELYEQGNWTWDTLLEYAKAATHDTNGDGVVDQYGVLLSPLDIATHALILSNGADVFYYDDASNKYLFAGNEPKAARALQLINDLVSMKVTSPSSSVKFDKFPSAIVIGKIVSDALAYKQIGMNYGIAPMPKGPDVSSTQFVEGNGVDAYFIPLNTDPKIAAAVIKEAFTYWDPSKSEYMEKKDIMETSLLPYLSTQADVDWVIEHFQSPWVSHIKCFETFRANFNTNIVQKVAWNESTPASALQAQASALQSDLESALQK